VADTDDVVTGLMNRFLMSDRFKVSRMKERQSSGQNIAEETDNMLTDPEIDPTALVWTIMSDLRGRTVDEVFASVEKRQGLERGKVETILNFLVNSGEMIKAVVKNTVIYTLKGCKMQQHNIAGRTLIGHNTVQQDSKYAGNEWKIDPLDPVDLALWKLMSDGKSRILDEMAETLGELGFNRQVIRQRFMSTIVHKNHYEARGTGTKKNYTLRKGIKAPGETKSSKLATTVLEELADTPPAVNAAIEAVARNMAATKKVPGLNAHQQEAVAAIQATIDTQITGKDSLDQCIWKVTQDQEWYTVKDVEMLLDNSGFRPGFIGTRIGNIFRDKKMAWFERTPIPGSRAFKYRMKDGIPYPADLVVDPGVVLNDMTDDEDTRPPLRDAILKFLEDSDQVSHSIISILRHVEGKGYDVVEHTVHRKMEGLKDDGLVNKYPGNNIWFLVKEDDEAEGDVQEVHQIVKEEVPAPVRPILTVPSTPRLTAEQSNVTAAIKDAMLKAPDETLAPTKGKTMSDLLASSRRIDATAKVDAAIAKAKAPADDDELLIEQLTLIKGVPFSFSELKSLTSALGTILRSVGSEAETTVDYDGLEITTHVVSEVDFKVKGIVLNRSQALQIINSFGN
jgi:hypothetical protein